MAKKKQTKKKPAKKKTPTQRLKTLEAAFNKQYLSLVKRNQEMEEARKLIKELEMQNQRLQVKKDVLDGQADQIKRLEKFIGKTPQKIKDLETQNHQLRVHQKINEGAVKKIEELEAEMEKCQAQTEAAIKSDEASDEHHRYFRTWMRNKLKLAEDTLCIPDLPQQSANVLIGTTLTLREAMQVHEKY